MLLCIRLWGANRCGRGEQGGSVTVSSQYHPSDNRKPDYKETHSPWEQRRPGKTVKLVHISNAYHQTISDWCWRAFLSTLPLFYLYVWGKHAMNMVGNSMISVAAGWPHSVHLGNISLYSMSAAFISSFATFLSILAPAGLPHSAEQITDDGSRRLRRFNFLLFIIAKQTTFKLLRLQPGSASKPPKSAPLPLQNLRSPTVPGWPPLPKIWLELQSWLDGVRGIKNQAITEKKLKSCVLYRSGVPKGGRGLG